MWAYNFNTRERERAIKFCDFSIWLKSFKANPSLIKIGTKLADETSKELKFVDGVKTFDGFEFCILN